MEDMGFLDLNPQYETDNNGWGDVETLEPSSSNVFTRWFYPQQTEAAQFQRENYFVNKENAYNEYMFNKANEYNKASAQMDRMLAAGINPNLAAAGIAGMGGNQATPMQGARGDTGMNTTGASPIEQLGNLIGGLTTGIQGANELGNLLGFGEKNIAEIKLIKQNAIKTAEEAKFTRKQRIQLQEIGGILVENARLEGKKIEAGIEELKKNIDLLQETKYKTAAETSHIVAQVGTEYETQRSLQLDNARKQFEKIFRDMFGAELTHDKLQFLVEACMNGKGENIVNNFTDTIASVIKGIKKGIKEEKTKEEKTKQTFWNPLGDLLDKWF